MSETADKAEEKLLESITKSQKATATESTEKTPATRKRSTAGTKKNQKHADEMDSNPRDYEMRNQFVGNLRWPD